MKIIQTPRGGIRFISNVIIVPCPRPRVLRTGHVYYPKNYTAWRKAEGEALAEGLSRLGGFEPLDGPIAASLIIRKKRATSDLDNILKSFLDLLQKYGAVVNDKNFMSLSAEVDQSLESAWSGFIGRLR